MRRVVGPLPDRQVALRIAAIRRLDIQRVVAADMAVRAGRHFSGRRELMGVL